MSWLCTTEQALEAKPPELQAIAASFLTNDTQVDDAAQAMIDLGIGGWDGFSGQMETGFGNVVEAIGTSMRSVAVAAGESEAACTTAAETLDELEIESDALLITAQEQLAELDALMVETAEWETKRYWRNQGVIQAGRTKVEDPATYDTAVSRLHDADVALYWIGTAAELKRGELTASQVIFDRIRTDEEQAEADLATALSPVHDTLSASELEFSADDVAGVDIVLDIFDLAALSIVVDGKDDATAKGALLDARNALAALLGIDTTERDERLAELEEQKRLERARAEIEELGPEELARLIEQAILDGDEAELTRLATLLFDGITGLSDDEALKYWLELSSSQRYLLILFGDIPPHPVILAELPSLDEGWWLSLTDEERRLFSLFITTSTMSIDDQINQRLEEQINELLEDPANFAALYEIIQDDTRFVPDGVGRALYTFLATHPDALAQLISAASLRGNADELQKLLDLATRGRTQDEIDALLNNVVSQNAPNTSDLDSAQWEVFALQLGQLKYQLNSTSDAGYDFGVLFDLALDRVPVVGDAKSTLESIAGGVQTDDRYSELEEGERRRVDNYLIAIAAVLAERPEDAAAIAKWTSDPDFFLDDSGLTDEFGGHSSTDFDPELRAQVEKIAADIEAGYQSTEQLHD